MGKSSPVQALPVEPEALRALLKLEHGDPHSILGVHPAPGGAVVRAYRPDALALSVIPDGGGPVPMSTPDAPGLFQAQVPGLAPGISYRLEARFDTGITATYRDPYAFLPTLGDVDLHLFGEGRHERLHEKLGARFCVAQDQEGFAFTVWAPNARGVSVVGDFNRWDGRIHPMRRLGASGVWELFMPGLEEGHKYKFEIRAHDGQRVLKADPYALRTELPPGSASMLFRPRFRFQDQAWMTERQGRDRFRSPMSIYEVHAGSWRRVPDDGGRPLNYRELADQLADYVADMGFTHVQFMPLMEHPFGGSWGYQVSAYLAPTARFGSPDDFSYLVDRLHRQGLGVIMDWVPAHFPKDQFALGRFDGTALYEHLDPRKGVHPDWDTFIFNYGRNEVRNFLLASALQWLEQHHVDGLRVDAVASMLYLDYSRRAGEWIPNAYGGRENLEAMHFIKSLNEVLHGLHPSVLMVAEESTAWGGVSRPTYAGGLGFGFKWNMGWMHDTLAYFAKDPVHRGYHHTNLTFGLLYAWSENFILPLSHDEVVHGKGSLLDKMAGDPWQRFANLRALYGYMWSHPGRKLLFMGGEFAQGREWHHEESLDWHLLQHPWHRGVQALVRDLNRIYRREPALWECEDEPIGFEWLDADNAAENVLAFVRKSPRSRRRLLCVSNFSPVIRQAYRVPLPAPGTYREVLNTDAAQYGGTNVGNQGSIHAEARPWHGRSWSAQMVLPPLATVWLEFPDSAPLGP